METHELKKIRVKLFGSLREFGSSQENGEVLLPAVRTIPELRGELVSFFREVHPDSRAVEILKDCAFADERSVLASDASIEGRSWLAVLPPVCGG